MAGEGIAGKHFRLSPHVHRRCIEVVDTVLYGIVYEAVHLVLVVRQAHHAEAQQRNLLARAVLYAVGHSVVFRRLFLTLSPGAEWLHGHHGYG